jgi:hypothetical protein
MPTRIIFQTPRGGVTIDPTGSYKDLGEIDVSEYSKIRVFAASDAQDDHAMIHLAMLDQMGQLVTLDVIVLIGASQVNRMFDIPGTQLRIQAAVVAVIEPQVAHIQVVIWGLT